MASFGLQVIYDGVKDRKASEGAVDIVAVHGLGADPEWTWVQEKNECAGQNTDVNWLKDLLPDRIPHIRILCFNYDSRWSGSNLANATLHDVAMKLLYELHHKKSDKQRPSIFVGHSFGGLVIEQAIVLANSNGNKYQHLVQSTGGIVFLGTPFLGTKIHKWGNLIADCLASFGLSEKGLLQWTKQNSESLFYLLHQFADIVSRNWSRKVFCFQELYPTPIGPFNLSVVDKLSATIPGVEYVLLEAHHRNMNKSGSKDDPRFKSISNAIDELVKGAWELIKGNFGLKGWFTPLFLGGSSLDKANDSHVETKTTQEEHDCLQCLFLSDSADDRQRLIDNQDEMIDEVCEWILSDKNYNSWFRSPSSQLLWLSGGPGKGKTFISIFLTGKLAGIVKQSQHRALIYFFCDSKDEKTNTAVAILRGLIFQLLSKWPDLFQYILPDFQTQRDRLFSSGSAFQGLWRIFENMIRSLKHDMTLYCVIDGFDECEPKSLPILSRKLGRLFSATTTDQSHGIFKLLVVSRDSPDCIRKQLARFGQRVDLDSPALEEGVISNAELFISHKSRMLFEEREYPTTLQKYIVEELMKNAKVGLLWVALVCEDLEQKEIIEVRNTLGSNLPTELDGIYRRILLQINETRREIATTIFRWVTAAVRPLKLSELAAATKTGPIESLSAEKVMRDKVGFCGSFLKIDRQDNVTFIHQSAKEYLLQKQLDLGPDSWFRVDLAAANLELAQTCLDYVQGGAFANGAVNIERHPDGRWYGGTESDIAHLREFPLLQYATLYWPEHSRALGPAEDIFDLSTPFFKQASPIRTAWLWTYWKIDHQHSIPHGILPCPPTLHIASSLGLTPLVEKIMVHEPIEIDSEANDDSGISALHCAVRGKHIDTVELLLQEGARINKKNKLGETVLHIAAEGGSGNVVKVLLENGIATDEKNERGETALHLAVQWGKEGIVKMLLERGAMVNQKDADGNTTLHLAVGAGKESIVKMLLNGSAEVNEKDADGNTALHLAARVDKKGITKMLLDRGAEVSEKDADGNTALHLAARVGEKGIVKILLDRGAEVSEKDADGNTTLHLAARAGKEGTVKMLLESGTEVHQKNADEETALHLAARAGNEETVKELLEGGAKVHEKGVYGRAALHLAVGAGKESIVKMLLDRGAEVSEKDADGNTALHLAARVGEKGIVKILLDRGAEVSEKDADGNTMLHLAARAGKEGTVKMLLESGTEVHQKNADEETALHLAARAGNEETVKELLEGGAKVHEKGVYGRAALHLAVGAGKESIVKMLLDRGAEVSEKDADGNTALHLAARASKEGTIKILLEWRAEVNEKDAYGNTALHLAARAGKEGTVKMLLEWRAEVNEKDANGNTALHFVAGAGKVGIAKMLLERGAKVNQEDLDEETALHLTARVGNEDAVGEPLKWGAKVNKKNRQGNSTLYLATRQGNKNIIEMPTQQGAVGKRARFGK